MRIFNKILSRYENALDFCHLKQLALQLGKADTDEDYILSVDAANDERAQLFTSARNWGISLIQYARETPDASPAEIIDRIA